MFDLDKACRDNKIIEYIKQGMSYAEVTRLPDIDLCAGTISTIVTSRKNYAQIAAARDKSRLRKISNDAFENYDAVTKEKTKRLTAQKIKKMTIGQLMKEDQSILAKIIKAIELG